MMSLVALVTDIRLSSVQTLVHSFLVRKFVNQDLSGLPSAMVSLYKTDVGHLIVQGSVLWEV